jgi:hypothetical protein
MKRVRSGLFAAGVAAALAFGAAQAGADPAPSADGVRGCNEKGCDAWCRSQGGIDGRCTEEGRCLCLY